MAWISILTWHDNSEDGIPSALRHIFQDLSHLSLFNFPDLLGAYLDLSGKTFGSVMFVNPRSAVDQADAAGRTTLSWAAQRGDLEAVKQLLGCGADPHYAGASGKRPLHWLAYAETSKCMRLLLDAKSFVHAKDTVGNTALIMAAELQDNTSFTELLLSHGADIESQDRDAWRPLHWAASRNRSAQMSVLLRKDADIHASTLKSTTALEYATTFNSH